MIVGQVDELQPDLLRQSADQVRLLDQSEVDQDAAEIMLEHYAGYLNEVVWELATPPQIAQALGRARTVVVETVDPPARFSFRWNHPRGEEPVAGNSMLVEFTLTPEGDEQTRLRVVESGHELRAWPDAEKERYAEEHRDGWVEFLDRLAVLVAKRRHR